MKEETLSRGRVTLLARPHVSDPTFPIEMNSGAMLASGASIGAVRLACDVIRFVWWPAQAPFSFDVDVLSARLQEVLPGSRWTPWRVRRYRAWAITFFRDSGNDRWVPIADYYRLPGRDPAPQVTAARRA